MKLLEEIKKAVTEANKTEDLETLINLNVKIAGYLYLLSEVETSAHKGYTDAYTNRKIEEAKSKLNNEGSLGDREAKSLIECQEFRIIENKFEVLWQNMKNTRFSTTEFIDVLKQKIAYLRKEKGIYENSNK
jgi:hypothetical protein